MINSMTRAEREKPAIIDPKRKDVSLPEAVRRYLT